MFLNFRNKNLAKMSVFKPYINNKGSTKPTLYSEIAHKRIIIIFVSQESYKSVF
jgi:hypothetical protein